MTADSFNEIDALMSATKNETAASGQQDYEDQATNNATHDFEATNSSMMRTGNNLIGNVAAETHFHSHFQVNSNILGKTKETLENYLVKRIAQLNSNRRAKSTSKSD